MSSRSDEVPALFGPEFDRNPSSALRWLRENALALLTHPQYADAARADADLLPAIIEESLRLDSPTRNATWRFVTEPMTLAGQPMTPATRY